MLYKPNRVQHGAAKGQVHLRHSAGPPLLAPPGLSPQHRGDGAPVRGTTCLGASYCDLPMNAEPWPRQKSHHKDRS